MIRGTIKVSEISDYGLDLKYVKKKTLSEYWPNRSIIAIDATPFPEIDYLNKVGEYENLLLQLGPEKIEREILKALAGFRSPQGKVSNFESFICFVHVNFIFLSPLIPSISFFQLWYQLPEKLYLLLLWTLFPDLLFASFSLWSLQIKLSMAYVGQSLGTGNWGCGVYNGNKELKFAIQWIAAAIANVPKVNYYVMGDSALANMFNKFQNVEFHLEKHPLVI